MPDPFVSSIAGEGVGDHLAHFAAQVGRLEHLEAVGVGEQLAQEVGSGAQVEGEVSVVGSGGEFALRVVQWKGAQVVGRPAIGTHDDVGHGRAVG